MKDIDKESIFAVLSVYLFVGLVIMIFYGLYLKF